MDAKSIRDQRDLKMANEAKAFKRWNARREFREGPDRIYHGLHFPVRFWKVIGTEWKPGSISRSS